MKSLPYIFHCSFFLLFSPYILAQAIDGKSPVGSLNITKTIIPPYLSGVTNIEFSDTDGNNRIDAEEDAGLDDFNVFFDSKESTISRLLGLAKPIVNDVFVYYVGHGAPDLKTQYGYFVPVGAAPNFNGQSGYSARVSSWHEEKQHRLFTCYFLKAIQNGNADSNKDKEMTYREIYAYVSNKTEFVPYWARRLSQVDQHPQL
jgi:hypothetical protein